MSVLRVNERPGQLHAYARQQSFHITFNKAHVWIDRLQTDVKTPQG